jgi:hypothetical protein
MQVKEGERAQRGYEATPRFSVALKNMGQRSGMEEKHLPTVELETWRHCTCRTGIGIARDQEEVILRGVSIISSN